MQPDTDAMRWAQEYTLQEPIMIETSNPAIHATSPQGHHEQPALMLVLGRWLAGDVIQMQLTVSTLQGGHIPMGVRKFSIPIEEDANVVQIATQIAATLSKDPLLESGYLDSEVAVRPTEPHHQLTLQPTIVFKPEGAQPRQPETDEKGERPPESPQVGE